MALSKQAFTQINRVLHNRLFKLKVNAVWQEIHDELGIGSLAAKYLLLSDADHLTLRQWVSQQAGVDPLTTKVSGDRLQLAAQVRNEKWATENVFSGMMQVSLFAGKLPLKQGEAIIPAATLLSVNAHDLLIDKIKTVVLVENGIIARYWHKCLNAKVLPQSALLTQISQALMVYRGHSSDAETVRDWIRALPAAVNKIGYFDFDPAGLAMAVDYAMHAILIPDPLDDSLLAGINNKRESFLDQLAQRPNLAAQLPKSCQSIWHWMSSNDRKCAVTQERLMTLAWSLRLLSLSDN